MEIILKNEIPTESCPLKREKVEWKRQEVRKLIVQKLNESGVSKISKEV